jgi:uncharacterized protein
MATQTAAKLRSRKPAKARRSWAHGHFHWNELRTRDAEHAKAFYATTIGWTFEAASRRTANPIGSAWLDGKPVAGLFPLNSPEFDDMAESWMSFLAVDDVDARVTKAIKAGAKLVMPVFDVPNVGRIAMLREPAAPGSAG